MREPGAVDFYFARLRSADWCTCSGGEDTATLPEVVGLGTSIAWRQAWEALTQATTGVRGTDAAYTATLAWAARRFGVVSGCLATPWDTAIELLAAAAREAALGDPALHRFRDWAEPLLVGHARLVWDGSELACSACAAAPTDS